MRASRARVGAHPPPPPPLAWRRRRRWDEAWRTGSRTPADVAAEAGSGGGPRQPAGWPGPSLALLSQPRSRADQRTRVCQIRFATGDRGKTGDGGCKVPHRAESSGDQSWPQALGSGRGGFRRAWEGNGQGGPSAAVSTKTEGSPRAKTICRPADRRGPTSRCGWRSPAHPVWPAQFRRFFSGSALPLLSPRGGCSQGGGPNGGLRPPPGRRPISSPRFQAVGAAWTLDWEVALERAAGKTARGPTPTYYCRSAKKWRVQACQRDAFVRLIGPNVDPPVWDCPAFGATTILLHLGGGGFGQDCAFHRLCGINEQFTRDVSAVLTTGLSRQDRAGPHLEPW